MSIAARALGIKEMPDHEQVVHQPAQDAPLAGRVVPEDDVRSARTFLRNSARELGRAKGECTRAGHMLKVTKALLMKKHNELSAAKAEVLALSSPEYLKALEADAKATAEYETLRSLREAALIDIEIYRTESATLRSIR